MFERRYWTDEQAKEDDRKCYFLLINKEINNPTFVAAAFGSLTTVMAVQRSESNGFRSGLNLAGLDADRFVEINHRPYSVRLSVQFMVQKSPVPVQPNPQGVSGKQASDLDLSDEDDDDCSNQQLVCLHISLFF